MNIKKILQTMLVCASCGLLSTAAAQQKVYVPADFTAATPAVEFTTAGPTLLFSDSPEMVYRNGILYRDKVEGDVRLFFHHVNAVRGKKKLAVMLKNLDSMRPVAYEVVRSGIDGFDADWAHDGKYSQEKYFNDATQQPAKGRIGFGKSVELLSGKGVLLSRDKLLTGTIDLHFDKPIEVSVLMCDPQSDLELFNSNASIQPMDEHPLRGTFAKSDWTHTLKEPVNAEQEFMLRVAAPDTDGGYAKGVDATTGLAAENYGNYGVIYHLNFKVEGKRPVSFELNPIGGGFAGYGVLENKSAGSREVIALPEGRLIMGQVITDAVQIGKLEAGEYSFIWSPPGASNLPVRFIWRAAEKPKEVTIKERLAELRAQRKQAAKK